MTETPVSLLERLRQPLDQEAWARFVDLYSPLVYAWGQKAGLQNQDALDLVQEVFTTLVQRLPTFAYDRQQSFRRWLRAVTLNEWRDQCKRKARQPTAMAVLPNVPDVDALEALWDEEYRRQLVRRALEIMRSDFQPVTWQACWQHTALGRPAAEVAAELNLTVGAVYAARFRVLKRLRQELGGLLD